MANDEENRELISRILQESDEDDEDEIDRILMKNAKQKGYKSDALTSSLVSKEDNLSSSKKESYPTSINDDSTSSYPSSSSRFNLATANKKKKDTMILDSMLKDLINTSSDEDEEDINEIINRDVRKKKFEEELNNDLNMEMSDDSDEDETGKMRQKIEADQNKKDEEEEKRMLDQIAQKNLLEIVELNEKKSEEQAKARQQNSYSVFAYDKNYYNIHKIEKKLIDHQRLPRIAEMIYNPSSRDFEGLPYCILQFRNMIFIGISQGLIRIFDVNTSEELKPLTLKKSKTTINRVLCMDITLTGEHLIVGYAEGNLALFDVNKQKLIIEITEVHYHEIENVKFLSVESPITFISGDKKGILYKVTVSKTLMIYSYKTELIMKKPFKEFCSMASLQPFKGMPPEVSYWHTHNIVAFSNTEELNVAVLGTNARKLYSITRSEFAKGFVDSGNLCYLDWGYGITPVVSREKSK